MKQFIRSLLFLPILLAASIAFAVPSMKVTVFDARGKVAFQGVTNATGTFTTGALQPGRYIVQFNSRGPSAVNGNQYALVISAGSKKVVADVVAGEKFLGGGVAMRIEVGSGLRIAGQLMEGALARIDPKTGQKLVWLRPTIGSNMPGRWVPADSAQLVSARNSGEIRREDLVKWQDHGDTEMP
jgi:hypothetical protein